MREQPSMLTAALGFARRGIPVFPVWSVVNGRCACGKDCGNDAGKHPDGDLAPHGVNDATIDEGIIRSWWTRKPTANIGIKTGEKVWVLDIDPKNGGSESYMKLIAEHGMLPMTVTVTTGGQGKHYYWATNGTAVKGKIGILPGIDVKSAGGYVVAPPSLHKSGNRYEFAPGEQELAEAPTWLIELINGKDGGRKERTDTSAAFTDPGPEPGKRYKTLVSEVGKLRRADVPENVALTVMRDACAKWVPAVEAEVISATVRRVFASYKPGPEQPPHPADDPTGPESEPEKQPEIQCSCPVCGSETCEDPSHVVSTALPAFRSAADVMSEPRPDEIVEGIAWAGKVSVLVSESGTGKTFVLLNMGAAISTGTEWMGRAVKHGSVGYVSFEGDAIGLRLRALNEAQGHNLANLYVLRASESLSPMIDARDRIELPSAGELIVRGALSDLRDSLAKAGRPPIRLIVIDTIRASLSGSEDSSEHVSAYLRVVRRIQKQIPDAGIILAHHAGWQDGETKRKRERGSSAFRGNADGTLYLELAEDIPERGEARLILTAHKVRDAEKMPPLHLLRRPVSEVQAPGMRCPPPSLRHTSACPSQSPPSPLPAETGGAVDAG